MTTTLFEGTDLLLQGDLLHEPLGCDGTENDLWEVGLGHLASSIHQAFATFDDEGALLVIEIDSTDFDVPEVQRTVLQRVEELARKSIRKTDLIEKTGCRTLVVCLPGSGRDGMTRVADAIRQRVWGVANSFDEPLATTVTVGAVHTTDAHLANVDELLLAARVNLDAARAAGGNRTNWSDLRP